MILCFLFYNQISTHKCYIILTYPVLDHRLWKALKEEEQHLCLLQSVETLLCGFQ